MDKKPIGVSGFEGIPLVTIPMSELVVWKSILEQGANPQVNYSSNWSSMTKQAIEASKSACREVIRLIEQACDD